jgi:SHS family sialic acid transporter-like MFS transporter
MTFIVPPLLRRLDKQQRHTFAGTWIGWTLDGFDFLVISFVLTDIAHEFKINMTTAATLVSAAFLSRWLGAAILGSMADRIGRKKTMIIGILIYSCATFMCAFSWNYWSLLAFRLLVGLGMAGEYGAGSALLMESWPDSDRRKASGLLMSGWAMAGILAAIVYPLVVPNFGWRAIFLIGIIPAISAVYVRLKVGESTEWIENKKRGLTGGISVFKLFGARWAAPFVLLIVVEGGIFLSNYPVLALMPSYLKSQGYGTDLVSTFMLVGSLGYLVGCCASGFLADRIGYRWAFPTMLLVSVVFILPIFFMTPSTITLGALIWLVEVTNLGAAGLVVGYVTSYFAPEVRAVALGMTHNVGSLGGALAPIVSTLLAVSIGLGPAIATVMLGSALLVTVVAGMKLPDRALAWGARRADQRQAQRAIEDGLTQRSQVDADGDILSAASHSTERSGRDA